MALNLPPLQPQNKYAGTTVNLFNAVRDQAAFPADYRPPPRPPPSSFESSEEARVAEIHDATERLEKRLRIEGGLLGHPATITV